MTHEQNGASPCLGEVIAIGDEITSGQRIDTNSAWLSQQLGDLGVTTRYHATVGDDLDASVRVFREAMDRSDVVVMTGGLGPTQDDLTRLALATAVGVELEVRSEALAHIESLFSKRGREMPARNRLQAEFPAGSLIIPNPQGTAPGIDLTWERDGRRPVRVLCLPGVPAEMKQMWNQTVVERLQQHVGSDGHVMHHVVKAFGVGESDMESRIPELLARDHQPRVGITVSRATISLRISATGETPQACKEQIERTKQELEERVGDYLYGEGEGHELEHAVADLLEANQQSMCCLEVGYDALADSWMSALERPDLFRGGVSITDAATAARLHQRLGLSDPVSTEAVATGMLDLFDADWTLAIDGYPSVRSDDQPLPGSEVRLIVAGRSLSRPRSLTLYLAGHPDVLPSRIAKSGLDMMRKILSRRDIDE